MKTFHYGGLEITVERLERRGGYQEYGIKIQAPGHPLYGFKIWHVSEADDRDVAQVLVYDLIEAYEDPLRFLQRQVDRSVLPREIVSADEYREFIRVAELLRKFLHQAHLDVYKDWAMKPMLTEDPVEKGPREWLPRRRKN